MPSRTCKRGMIRRSAFTRKSGRKVAAACVRNMGESGKWTQRHRTAGTGKLRKGRLSKYGYALSNSATTRHAALKRAAAVEGARPVFRMLQAVATYTKRTSPASSKKFLADRNYVRKMF